MCYALLQCFYYVFQVVRMMAAVPLSSASLLPLLDCLEDEAAGLSEQTDAYITIAK